MKAALLFLCHSCLLSIFLCWVWLLGLPGNSAQVHEYCASEHSISLTHELFMNMYVVVGHGYYSTDCLSFLSYLSRKIHVRSYYTIIGFKGISITTCVYVCVWCVCVCREGMKRMADFEQQQDSISSSLSSAHHKFIAPINSAGGDQLLQAVSSHHGNACI